MKNRLVVSTGYLTLAVTLIKNLLQLSVSLPGKPKILLCCSASVIFKDAVFWPSPKMWSIHWQFRLVPILSPASAADKSWRSYLRRLYEKPSFSNSGWTIICLHILSVVYDSFVFASGCSYKGGLDLLLWPRVDDSQSGLGQSNSKISLYFQKFCTVIIEHKEFLVRLTVPSNKGCFPQFFLFYHSGNLELSLFRDILFMIL